MKKEKLLTATILLLTTFALMAYAESPEVFDLKYNPSKGQVLKFEPQVEFTDDIFLLDDAVDFIIRHEGFQANCYEDAGGLSHGYGHLCIGGKITKARSRAIVKREVERLYQHIPHDFQGKQIIGILGFLYNHPFGQDRYIEMLWSDRDAFMREIEHKANNYTWLGGVRYGGLKYRRQEELSLINNF